MRNDTNNNGSVCEGQRVLQRFRVRVIHLPLVRLHLGWQRIIIRSLLVDETALAPNRPSKARRTMSLAESEAC